MEEEIIRIEPASFFLEIKRHPFLCQSCGMCKSVCNENAIEIVVNQFQEYIPEFNEEKCINCKKCILACPARRFTNAEPSILGEYKEIFLAKSTNIDLNRKGASGGVITALADFALKQGVVNEILSVDFVDSKVVATPRMFKEDIVNSCGSKYVSKPLCTKFDKKKEKLGVTALPCQAKAIKRQNHKAFVFGMFCSKLSTEDLIRYILKGSKPNTQIKNITFREGPWPGRVAVTFENDEVVYHRTARSSYGAALNSYIFTNSGCLLCDDYFAEKADVSFGDPWGHAQYNDDYLGETVVIVRSEKAEKLIREAIEGNVITATTLDYESVVSNHVKEIFNKKSALQQRCEYFNSVSGGKIRTEATNFVPYRWTMLLNYYLIFNNWILRKIGCYRSIFYIPKVFLFFTRFSHAFLVSKLIKRSGMLDNYLSIAKKERS